MRQLIKLKEVLIFNFLQYIIVHELESTVEDLTKGYLSAAKSKKSLSFGRLKSAVDKELK